jgi:hypothetical protein
MTAPFPRVNDQKNHPIEKPTHFRQPITTEAHETPQRSNPPQTPNDRNKTTRYPHLCHLKPLSQTDDFASNKGEYPWYTMFLFRRSPTLPLLVAPSQMARPLLGFGRVHASASSVSIRSWVRTVGEPRRRPCALELDSPSAQKPRAKLDDSLTTVV